MFLSIFDIFKIGIGPSSSHTMGPMSAAASFLCLIKQHKFANEIDNIKVSLYGSLAFTGKGHATDRAIILGLLGYEPANIHVEEAEQKIALLQQNHVLHIETLPQIQFNPDNDIVFDYGPPLPGHANGMIFNAFAKNGKIIVSETYYSIGGGFVVTAKEREIESAPLNAEINSWPYPFANAAQMLDMAKQHHLTIADMKYANEQLIRSSNEIDAGIDKIWAVMNGCIERGLEKDGELPGGLKVRRRAKKIYNQLLAERLSNISQPHVSSDWLSVYAMAVNEENAAGGRVVTAPTNGASGVIPAVLRYYLDHCHGANLANMKIFLLTAAAIGGLIKHNASISGAEAGCQGEVGSAAAMAAAGLCAALGGSPAQIENAAEIALEHHLGMTCDPVAGLVQVPCIERNGLGATKAVAAASLSLRGDGTHFMPLDNCIEAMRQTGEDMNSKFKETSLGGLAVNIPEC